MSGSATNRVKGTMEKAKGSVEKRIGKVTANRKLEEKGTRDRVKGRVDVAHGEREAHHGPRGEQGQGRRRLNGLDLSCDAYPGWGGRREPAGAPIRLSSRFAR